MRQIRRILTAVFVLLGAVIVVPAFAGIASAHHSNITASVACTGTVSWTATSWSTGLEGTNTDILVTKTVNGTTTTVQHGAFNAGNNYQFSGTFAWPANANSIVIKSIPVATWGNGNTSKTGDSVTIYKPSNCPGQPGVSKSASCVNTSPGNGSGTAVVTLTNAAGPYGASVKFKVYNPNSNTVFTEYTVPTGGSTPVSFTGLADGSYTVKILVGSTSYDQSFTIDCDSPLPSVSHTVVCANGDGQVVVTLTNSGGEAVTFKVTDPATLAVENVTVDANSSKTRTFSGFADGTHTVIVKVGQTDYSQTFTVDCDHPLPKVSNTVACADNDGSVTVTLKNEGTEAAVFQITNPNTGIVESVTVGIGQSTTRTYGGFNDGTHSVTVTAYGQDYTQTFSVNCDAPPSFSHTETCVNGDGVVQVTMTNNGDDVNAVFVLEGVTHTLAPGATKVVALDPMTDGSHLVSLIVNNVDKSFTVIVDCDRPGEPAVEIAQDCANEDGIVVVTLKNIGGQLPLTFTVQGTNYPVPANSTLDVPVGGLLDGDQTIVISQGANDFSKPVTIDCDLPPTINYSEQCVEGDNGVSNGEVIVTLHNNGDDVAVTFTVNGTPYPVGPNALVNATVSGLADGTHTIEVYAGTIDLSFDIEVTCDQPGEGTISVLADCAENDGLVIVTLIATGGELPVLFTVQGVDYLVDPDTTLDVPVSGLNDGTNRISVFAGQNDLSFDVETLCDLTPTYSYVQACASFDDTVSVLIANPGDDVDVTFTINGTDYVLIPGAVQTVLVDHLADGPNTITIAINGEPQEDIVVESDCDPVFGVTAVCNSGAGEGTSHWFTITNTESTDVTVTWSGGSATVPAGNSTVINSTSAPLVLLHNGAVIAQAAASEAVCQRDVEFTKELLGQPATGETYTIRISRLVGDTYVEELTFNINANETKTITLPSTLDPAGIDYKIEEIVKGTASTSAISPDQFKLSGHLGETIDVVVTNGYAAVQIDKTTSSTTVVPGGQITYTLQATNTGGLTLNPVVVSDRLPSMMELASASVAGGAGQCVLTETTRPQLLTCTMNGSLAPGALTSLITVVVNVDSTVAVGSTIVNQAMVHGAYASDAVLSGLGGGFELSCLPARAGTVCDLSAQVGVPVSDPQVASAPPVPTVTPDAVVVQLPRTGAEHLKEMLVLGFGGILLGGAMLLGRRRFGVR